MWLSVSRLCVGWMTVWGFAEVEVESCKAAERRLQGANWQPLQVRMGWWFNNGSNADSTPCMNVTYPATLVQAPLTRYRIVRTLVARC